MQIDLVYGQILSRYCPKDKYHYTACYQASFTPLVFNNTTVAVCGHYICYDGDYVVTSEHDTLRTRCNNRVECNNGDVDERYCTEEEEEQEMTQCRYLNGSVMNEISISRKCDGKCNCFFCDDEWSCNGYNYYYKCNNSSRSVPSSWICNNYPNCEHGDDESNCRNVTTCVVEYYRFTYVLANYSRCTMWIQCANKLDQTNCSDSTLAPLQCPVGGYISIVSQYIICRSIIYTSNNIHHTNTSTVCDDGMDVQCVTPTPGCYIHKHQICNNITDCKGGSDEKNALCSRVTSKSCKRKYHYDKSLKLPISWIGDDVEDCVDSIDENITKWNSCMYSTFTIYGSYHCEDIYICPFGYPLYVEIPSLCDEMLSCEGGNGICDTAALTSPQVRYTPVKVENWQLTLVLRVLNAFLIAH